MSERALAGCLLGIAVGDAIGLPYEGLTPERGRRMFPDASRHHLLGRRGMISDDTEHSCMVGMALLKSRGDVEAFSAALAQSLRWWLLGAPAGVGLATLRAILKLWCGVSPAGSGVWSAGNGAAMRAPLLGVVLGNDLEALKAHVRASTLMTHTDPRACAGALAVALAAWWSAGGGELDAEFMDMLEAALPENCQELVALLDAVRRSVSHGQSVGEFASGIGGKKGISGYVYQTVPCVLHAWMSFPTDYAAGIRALIQAGGDVDTTCAIYGGIVGARVGKAGIPEDWLKGLIEWPRTVAWMERLAFALATEKPELAPRLTIPGVLLRNLAFALIVLGHGFRRLVPPY